MRLPPQVINQSKSICNPHYWSVPTITFRNGLKVSSTVSLLLVTALFLSSSQMLMPETLAADGYGYGIAAKTDAGGRAGVSQPYFVCAPLSGVDYSYDAGGGDQFFTSTAWMSTDASMSISLSSGESIVLFAVAQVWNDYATVGSSIAICREHPPEPLERISGDMFCAGATMAKREIAAAIAISTYP